MRGLRLLLAALLLTCAWPSVADAGVNVKNGNYYIGYTDFVIRGEMEFSFSRTYNSLTRRTGPWGRGWGTNLDTHLEVRDDGSLVVHEHGTGSKVVFDRPGVNDGTTDPGASWAHNGWYGNQRILRINGGYSRTRGSDLEHYDDAGRLVRMAEGRAGHSISLIRDGDGRVVRMSTDTGNEVELLYDRFGHVERIDIDRGKASVEYRYEGDCLVWSRDAGGNEYVYEYDRDGLMEQIRHVDGARVRMTYNGSDLVASVSDRSGELTTYDYYNRAPTQTEWAYGTITTTGDTVERLDYISGVTGKGRSYTRRRTWTEQSGDHTKDHSTEYNEQGLPIRVQEGAGVTEYRYDDRGQLIFTDNGTVVIEREYHPVFGKIARTVERASGGGPLRAESRFEYNEHGELERAEDHNGLWTELDYDDKGRISTMRSSRGTLSFEYNAARKPIVIRVAGIGAVDVSYDEAGEISKFESARGHTVVLEVSSAFQELLTLVKPANVSL